VANIEDIWRDATDQLRELEAADSAPISGISGSGAQASAAAVAAVAATHAAARGRQGRQPSQNGRMTPPLQLPGTPMNPYHPAKAAASQASHISDTPSYVSATSPIPDPLAGDQLAALRQPAALWKPAACHPPMQLHANMHARGAAGLQGVSATGGLRHLMVHPADRHNGAAAGATAPVPSSSLEARAEFLVQQHIAQQAAVQQHVPQQPALQQHAAQQPLAQLQVFSALLFFAGANDVSELSSTILEVRYASSASAQSGSFFSCCIAQCLRVFAHALRGMRDSCHQLRIPPNLLVAVQSLHFLASCLHVHGLFCTCSALATLRCSACIC
jgi:hypothetical protein